MGMLGGLAGGMSRPTPGGEVGGSGQGVSRPRPRGDGGVWPGGIQAHTQGGCIPACTEADSPVDSYCSEWYASYWNAFLSCIFTARKRSL